MNPLPNKLDWRNPVVRFKNHISESVKDFLGVLGFWIKATGKETTQFEVLEVVGSKPSQRRLKYTVEPPEFEVEFDVVYSPEGNAFKNNKIVERYSIRRPSVMEIIKGYSKNRMIEQPLGTIVEMETPYTYGDWVADFLCSVTSSSEIIEPIVLPICLAEKAYVIRDLKALGLTWVVANQPIKIKQARILRKRIPSYYWSENHVRRYQKAFRLNPKEPKKGSFIYLARFDTKSESVQRRYPSEEISALVSSLGGAVINTRNASPELFDSIADSAETVIADQGSALFGVMHWRTKNVIELTNHDWWHSANLFIANGAGVTNYVVLAVDQLSIDLIKSKIVHYLTEKESV